MKLGDELGRDQLLLGFWFVVLFSVFMAQQRFAEPPSIDEAHVFDVDRAIARLARILGDEEPHPVDSITNDQVRERLVQEIRALGFAPLVRDDFHCRADHFISCARVQNIVFWVGAPGPNAVMMASHYDSVPAGPGAADDGAGVAVSLEIASLLKNRLRDRALLVLITDGEEAGLLGAASFVERDPLARQVTAVVNMEARGTTGAVTLFQTSRPNGRDIAGLTRSGSKPAANSLSADIYELLPNDTDMTVFLQYGMDGANFAFAHGARNYHTPNDTLANLDRASVFHMGTSVLASVESLLDQEADTAEIQMIYADVLGRGAIVMPQTWGFVLILAGGLAAFILFLTFPDGAPWWSFLAPGAVLMLGAGLAVGAGLLLAALRSETSFGAAHPGAVRAVLLSAALVSAGVVYGWVGKVSSGIRLWASGWIWFAVLGLLAFPVTPGASILFAPAMGLFLVAALAGFLVNIRHAALLSLAGVLLFVVLALPLSAHGENALFVENAAPFVIFPLIAFVLTTPLIVSPQVFGGQSKIVFGGLAGGALLTSLVFALLVPAYSDTAPRPLSIAHVTKVSTGEAYWSMGSDERPPESLNMAVSVEKAMQDPLPGVRYVAPAPAAEGADSLTFDIVRDTRVGENRVVQIAISAPNADRVWLRTLDASAIRAIRLNGEPVTVGASNGRNIFCHGRSCRGIDLELTLDPSKPAPSFYLMSMIFGAEKISEPIVAARPSWAVPVHTGDFGLTWTKVEFEPQELQ